MVTFLPAWLSMRMHTTHCTTVCGVVQVWTGLWRGARKEGKDLILSYQSQVSTWHFQLGAGPTRALLMVSNASLIRPQFAGNPWRQLPICLSGADVVCNLLLSAIFCYLSSSAICRLLLSVLAARFLLHNQKRGVVFEQNAIFWMIHLNNFHFSGPTPCYAQTGGCYLYPLKHMLHILLSPVLEFRVRSRTLFGCLKFNFDLLPTSL